MPDSGRCWPPRRRRLQTDRRAIDKTEQQLRWRDRRREAAAQETARLSINNELQGVRAQNKTLPEQSRAYTKQLQAEHRRRALILESARLIPAGPHTAEALQRIVETWEISPEAAPVLDRYQQPDQASQRQDRAGPEIGI